MGKKQDEYFANLAKTREPTSSKNDDEIREIFKKVTSLYEGSERDRIIFELLLEIRTLLKEKK